MRSRFKIPILFGKDSLWHPVLPDAKTPGNIGIICQLAHRLTRQDITEKAISIAKEQTNHPDAVYWLPHGIAQGDAGLALMFGHFDLCFPNEGWDKHAHAAIARACESVASGYSSIGLYAGLSGLSYTTLYLSRDGVRYKKLLAALDLSLLPQINDLCNKYIPAKNYTAVDVWDVISGFSGIARYLTARGDDPITRPVLEKVLDCLVALTEDLDGLPRWFTPPELSPGESMQEMYPQGSLNCGMAHGIPGPLAALSLAKIHAVEVDGQEVAIRRIADWLLSHRLDDKYGMNWPAAISVKNMGEESYPQYVQTTEGVQPTHTGWCYGPSGVASSVWLAGKALDDQHYRDISVEVMRAVFAKPIAARKLFNPGMCHGFAGQMQIAMRFAHNTGLPEFAEEAKRLARFLLDEYYDPDSLLGFQSQDSPTNKIDQAGVLDGASGVILALLSALTDVEPKWDQIFMLS